MTEEQKRKYRLLDNKTAENGQWDFELLDWELEDLDFDEYDFGFEMPEDIDVDDFFDRGVETKEKEEVYGVKVICGTEQQRDDLIAQLEEQGFAPKAI